tara:strand:+ start:1360 stop:2775 length:1416 start_codon:yes stop_codon:yes gene_type:complete
MSEQNHSRLFDKWTYRSAVDHIMSLVDFERSTHSPNHSKFHLERMNELLEFLNHPQKDLHAIHIAGTKGKGSTAALIASILQQAKYNVGLYTSPHLHTVRERIQINQRPLTEEEFARITSEIWGAVEFLAEKGKFGPATTFEVLTAMSFLAFRKAKLDFEVIEVGLGGRLDATNVIHPLVSLITSISLDHTATLGESIKQITMEKAGIIKHEVPVVAGFQYFGGVLEILKKISSEKSAEFFNVKKMITTENLKVYSTMQEFDLSSPLQDYKIKSPLIGDYQIENIASAVACVEILISKGYQIEKEAIERGVENVKWPARLQSFMVENQRILVDGAHNPFSAFRLIESIQQHFKFRKLLIVFGTISGHDTKLILKHFSSYSPLLFLGKSRHPKATNTSDVKMEASSLNLLEVSEFATVGDALQRAINEGLEDDLILVTGSLSVAAEAIEYLQDIPPEIYPNISGPTASAENI